MQNSHRSLAPAALPDEWRGLQWPRWTAYRVVRPGEPGWAFPPGLEWCAGRFEPGSGQAGEPYDVEHYDPVPVAPELLDAALRIAPEDDNALLGFVQRWGVPGVGKGSADSEAALATSPQSQHSDDTVWAVRRLIREIQRHFAWLRALQSHQTRSPAIPSLWEDQDACLDEARTLVAPPEHAKLIPYVDESPRYPTLHRFATLSGPDPYLAAFAKGHYLSWWARTQVRPRDRERVYWHAFGESLTQHLRLIHPTIRWAAGRPVAAWVVRRPADVLWVQLWSLATGGAAIRQCRHCHRWFAVDRRGKVYCSRVCTNRASAKASYEARKGQPKRRKRR